MRRAVALLTLLGGGASLWLGCDQIFGLGDANTIPYPDGGADGTTGGDTGSDTQMSGDSPMGTDGGDASDSGTVGDGTGDAPVDSTPACNPAVVWAKMFDAALVPPYLLGGLDLRGADDAGITIQEIQAAACQIFDGGPNTLPGQWTAYWGGDGSANTQIINVSYDPTSGRYTGIDLFPGYTGALDFHGADGGTYHIGLSGDVTKNDASFPLDWANADAAVIQGELTELRNAMVATFAPGTPPSSNCKLDQTCNGGPAGAGIGFFGVRAPLFIYIAFNDTINHPSQPSYFYAFTNFLQFNDPGQANLWASFDTTALGSAVKNFAGVAVAQQNAMFLVPSGNTPFARFDLTSNGFANADAGAWSTFDPSGLTPATAGFAGGAFDGQFLYAAGSSGVCAQYDSFSSFTTPGAWSTFDTKTLTPPGAGFAGVVPLAANSGAAFFAPSQDGVIAAYVENAMPSDFTVGTNWLTYDLTQVNPRLKQFYGAVTIEYNTGSPPPIYLVPNKDTVFGAYAGWPAPLDQASSWKAFDVSSIGAPAPAYSTGVHDQARYVYFSPAASGGYPAVRYDTTKAFDDPTAWEVGLGTINVGVKATGFDGQYVYFVGDSTTVYRYDTTQSFTSAPGAWTSFDVHAYDKNAVGFGGTGNDGRYQYFIPHASSVAMRFDSRLGPGFPRSTFSSF
jgi:hypothetical protein